jgi:2-oxoglutarate ferredoxin oxidoreductase subunit delta
MQPAAFEVFVMTETKQKREEPKIDIYKAWCKGCGICVAFCPTGALAKDEAGYPYVQDIEKCINCGWCEIRCPDFAITVEKKTKGKRRAAGKGEKARSEREENRNIASRQ